MFYPHTYLSLIHISKIVRNRFPVSYKPNAPKPVLWLQFLDGLLYPEDIPALQEYIGYCLIPSNKGQRMMVIKGNGGEGKSQIGAVLGALFGSNMKDGSIGKISVVPCCWESGSSRYIPARWGCPPGRACLLYTSRCV